MQRDSWSLFCVQNGAAVAFKQRNWEAVVKCLGNQVWDFSYRATREIFDSAGCKLGRSEGSLPSSSSVGFSLYLALISRKGEGRREAGERELLNMRLKRGSLAAALRVFGAGAVAPFSSQRNAGNAGSARRSWAEKVIHGELKSSVEARPLSPASEKCFTLSQ